MRDGTGAGGEHFGDLATIVGSASWPADRLTRTRTSPIDPSRCDQSNACLEACSSTHSPSGTISPASSAIGTNSGAPSNPRSGCCQRRSASAPITLSTPERDLGLIEDPEFVVFESAAQIRLGLQARHCIAADAIVVQLESVAAAGLGAVDRGDGVAQQVRGVAVL